MYLLFKITYKFGWSFGNQKLKNKKVLSSENLKKFIKPYYYKQDVVLRYFMSFSRLYIFIPKLKYGTI